MNKRELNKLRIRAAVMDSLERLIRSREKITQAAVIANAVFQDGSSLGKTTLYRKNLNTKEFVHGDLLREIDLAASNQVKKSGNRTKAETMHGLREQVKDLKKENARLVDEIVSQQEKIRVITQTDTGNHNQLQRLEDDCFVMGLLLDGVVDGAIPELKKMTARYMDLHAGSERLELAFHGINRYRAMIKDSTITMTSLRKFQLQND
ncbi:hypothetical protein [Zhongshania sp. BJYM1]|uniref:hypothetical protein n=1 Tax=Zhongshania aquatica TaxID=2965069 RepID=UPI0022B2F87C|nr:hypothetical protein [Marortus sp. BJYM1]